MEITNLLLENRSMERSRAAQGITNWKRLLPNYDKKLRATFQKETLVLRQLIICHLYLKLLAIKLTNETQNKTKIIKRKTETAIIKHTTPTADTRKLNILT